MSPSGKTLSAFLPSDDGRPLTFKRLSFGHSHYVLYWSDYSHNLHFVPVQTKKEPVGHLDVGIATHFQFTTTTWMMWPYILAGLVCGTRTIVYEGSTFYRCEDFSEVYRRTER
ncbi:hypothetical protein BJY52DRAFT_1307364 [Lactarius psammicola]|nr:hypothetical protein BJY52DRAFT_1307364 [Lactarius psammicola]